MEPLEPMEADSSRTPDHDDLRFLIGAATAAARRDRERAIRILESHDFGRSTELVALVLKGCVLEEADDRGAAAAAYSEAARVYPDDALPLLRLGVLSYRSGDLTMARRYLEHSWALAPGPEAAYYLGELIALGGHREEGRRFLAEAVARSASDSRLRSMAYARLDELAESR